MKKIAIVLLAILLLLLFFVHIQDEAALYEFAWTFDQLASPPDNGYEDLWQVGSVSPDFDSSDALVTISLMKETLTPYNAMFVIRNKSQNEVTFGLEYFLQVQVEGKWHEMQRTSDELSAWLAVGLSCPPFESRKRAANWWTMYGILPSGTYRLVKPINDSERSDDGEPRQIFLTAEFTL